MIPHDEHGYAVDRESRTVHRRYAPHAAGLPRTRAARGVVVYLGSAEPVLCRDCFPPQPKARRKR